MKKIVLLTPLAALALAVPGYADKPANAGNGNGNGNGNGHGKSHKCTPHKVGYVARGTLVSSSLTPGTKDGTYNGTIVVHVTKTNHHAKSDRNSDVTYTLSNARVTFGDGVDKTAPAAGDRVNVQGKITQLSKHCDQTGFTPAVTVRKVEILAPKPPSTSGDNSSGNTTS